MNTMMDIAHIDIGYQIDNPWNKPTSLALKFNKIRHGVKIKETDKKKIKHNTDWENQSDRKRRKIIAMVYSYLLYKLLSITPNSISEVLCCRDVNPPRDIKDYLRHVSNHLEENIIIEEKISINFKNNSDGNSRAHKLAKAIAKGRVFADIIMKEEDINNIIILVKKIILAE
jgi:hypothetical protein